MVEAWFVSDCHLGLDHSKNQSFVNFLKSISKGQRKATHLFFCGDIFNLWIGSNYKFINYYKEIIETIIECRKSGVEIVYIEGNHDIHIKDFWSQYDIKVYQNDIIWHLNGKKVYLTHGDFINFDDKFYHKYIRFLRSKSAKTIIDFFPDTVWWSLGNYLTKRSRHYSNQKFNQDKNKLPDYFKSFCEKIYQTYHFDLLISGHIHQRLKISLSQDVWAYNLGSWLEDEFGFLCMRGNDVYWEFL